MAAVQGARSIDRLGREGHDRRVETDAIDDDQPSPNLAGIKPSRPYGASPPRQFLDKNKSEAYDGYAYRPQLPYRVTIEKAVGGRPSSPGPDAEDRPMPDADGIEEGGQTPAPASGSNDPTPSDQPASPGTLGDIIERVQRDEAETASRESLELEFRSKLNEMSNTETVHRWIATQSSIVMLPNEAPTAYIPIRSAAFVKTVNEVKFKDGTITSWSTERPSEALEIVRLPVKILRSIVSIPADLIKMRIDLSSSEATLAEKQVAQIEAQAALQLVQECITTARILDIDPLECFPEAD